MVYKSELLENNMKKDFNARMELYLNSKSIHEYLVERDLKGLNEYTFTLSDEFLWWYILKEEFGMFMLGAALAVVLGIAIPVLLYICGLWWVWSIAVAMALEALVSLFIATTVKTVNCLSEKRVDASIDSSRDYFARVDARMSAKQMPNE